MSITLPLLAILIMLLVLLIILGLGVYYLFNKDKIEKWVLGDDLSAYKTILQIKR